MKLELDFDNKTITVKDTVNAGELMQKMQQLKINLKEWSMGQEVQAVDNGFFQPITQPLGTYPWTPANPYPFYTFCDTPSITIT